MAFTDEYKFSATAGKGGDGVVRWRREKFRPKGGPSGGDGGRGGHVYIEAVRDVTALHKIAHNDSYQADHGQPGAKNSMHGADAKDFTLYFPIGSVVTNVDTGELLELLEEGERVLLLRGGEGGLGNEQFKSSTNQRPMQATKGKDGEHGSFEVELKLIADVGLVGLPNAGKTSLLNALTNAGARVGEYPFTTLNPNLGVYYGFVLADIPGLIEGASTGKGLGDRFLRHISRTNVIIHCISLEQDNITNVYNTIRGELASHPEIAEKKEYVVLTKNDTVDADKVKDAERIIKEELKLSLLGSVTILDDNSIKELGDALIGLLRSSEAD